MALSPSSPGAASAPQCHGLPLYQPPIPGPRPLAPGPWPLAPGPWPLSTGSAPPPSEAAPRPPSDPGASGAVQLEIGWDVHTRHTQISLSTCALRTALRCALTTPAATKGQVAQSGSDPVEVLGAWNYSKKNNSCSCALEPLTLWKTDPVQTKARFRVRARRREARSDEVS